LAPVCDDPIISLPATQTDWSARPSKAPGQPRVTPRYGAWSIILSFRTGVTGAGKISAQSYRLFVHEVSDRLGLAFIGPAPTDAETGSSPF